MRGLPLQASLMAGLLAATAVHAAPERAAIRGVAVEADQVTLYLTRPVTYGLSMNDRSGELTLDLNDTVHGAADKTMGGKGRSLKSVRTGRLLGVDAVTRVVVAFKEGSDIRVAWADNALVVSFAPGVEPQAAARPRPASGGRYFVQVGAFGNESLAQALRDRLVGVCPVAISTVAKGGGALFRVRAGPFHDKAAAEAAAAKLDAAGERPVVVFK